MIQESEKLQERIAYVQATHNKSSGSFLQQQFTVMILVSIAATLGILICAIIFEIDLLYKTFVCIIPIFFATMAMFNYLDKYNWARFTGTAILPLWINLATIFRGTGFSESAAMMAFLIFTYVLYSDNHKARSRIILFTLISHVGVLLYLNFYPPIMGTVHYPYDEIVVFLLSVGWIMVFVKKLEHRKNQLITRLQEKNERLMATTEELERFTYIASHDLKSPLRTIISFSDLIDRHLKREDYESIKEDLSFIKSGAKQMNYLISDILEFSKINGQKIIQRKRLNLTNVLDIAISNLSSDINESNARIYKKSLPYVLGNETEFIILFQNLIQNGIKYNNNKIPIVKIWAEQEYKVLKIYFRDNGIGIDEAYHDQIFQFFKRLHTNEQYNGTGLGLGLCTKIINNYNGTIKVESSSNKGSTFCISIPNLENSKIKKQQKIEAVEA